MEWIRRDCPAEALAELEALPALDPLRARLLAVRGVRAGTLDEFLVPQPAHLSPPEILPGAVQAAETIIRHAAAAGHIVVFGDYDCDGICASAILHRTLEAVWPGVSSVFIPKRLEEGYGMSTPSVARMLAEHPDVSLVVTVDNGIGSAAEVAMLAGKGVECIVTDHHLPGSGIPQCIVVNPKVSAPPRLSGLCGAGVAFMIARAVVSAARRLGAYSGANVAGPLLVLAGLATVGDLMPLDGENRTIVSLALSRFDSLAPVGLKELLLRASRSAPVSLGAVDFSFRLVPRINADGRLGDASTALALLLTSDREESRRMAMEVDLRNTERKNIEKKMTERAMSSVRSGVPAQVIALEDGHRGVSGIAAARILDSLPAAEKVPVAVIVGHHGSARAPDGWNVRDALDSASAALSSFGGHAAAGGFTVRDGMLDEFARLFRDACAAQLGSAESGADATPYDAEIALKDVTPDLAEWIGSLEPFGEGNPVPVFLARNVFISEARPFGQDGRHLQFKVRVTHPLRAVWWNRGDEVERVRLHSSRPFDILFKISLSCYGEPHPELDIVAVKPSRQPAGTVSLEA